ncbi:MAG: outer membrane protein [Cyclobacteriaceae bacterium]|jgi:outer membrane protein
MRTLLLLAFTLSTLFVIAQEDQAKSLLTLDNCIDMALERNVALKQARNNEIIAESNRFQSIMNFFPSLNAGINYDFYFGNFFDTNAARQVSATSNSSNPNLSTNVILFNGFSNQYRLQQSKQLQDAAIQNTQSTQQDVETTILTMYLNVILDKENIKIAEERVTLLESQLDREKKRESVGVGNLESVYNFQGQIANQRLTLNNFNNQLKRDMLSLFQAMQMDPNTSDVEPYDVDEMDLLFNVDPFEVILEQSLNSSPALMAANANQKSSMYQYKIAKAQRYPTISAFGRIGSNYSSNGARNPTSGDFDSNADFRQQMKFNEFEYVNISMSIPIFTKFQTSNNIQTARINMTNADLDVSGAMNTVTNLIQNAYLDLVTAQSTYVSTKENLNALDQSYEFVKKRYETGNTDFYSYLESLNNKNRAEIELVNAKYSIIFRKKILDLYRGN